MAAFTSIALGIGAAASVAGVVGQQKAAKQQARAQRQAAAEQQKAQQLQYRRSQRQAIRQAQLARAQSIVTAGAVGGDTGSGSAGGLSGLGSQLGGNLGYGSQLSGLNANIGAFNQQAANAAFRGQTFGALAGIGKSLFSFGASNGGLDFLLPQPTGSNIQVPNYTG